MTYIKDLLQKWSIEAIIFDLDGTLIDTLDQHIEAFQRLFQELDLQISYDQIAQNMGRTPKDTLLSLLPELKDDKERLEKLANRKEAILTKLLKQVPVLKGAYEVLSLLQKFEIPICLASSTPRFNVMKMLKIAKLTRYFQVIVTGEDIIIGKPNPEVFIKAANKASTPKTKVLVIGDSLHDILAAKNAQMKVIAVSTGKHSEELLQKEKPNLVIADLKELI